MKHEGNLFKCVHDYATRGWQVFPLHSIRNGKCTCGNSKCKSPGKHPRIKGGFKTATDDANQIKAWWSKWPNANIGVVTGKRSGLFILDLDHKEDPDKDGLRSMAGLSKKSGDLPTTPKVKTGGGGEHYYFKMPKSDVRNSTAKIATGIDTRANGGYIVAPPSLHISGHKYKWLNGPKTSLAEVPEWIITASSNKTIAKKTAKNGKTTRPIKEGKRNSKLVSLAGKLRKRGLEFDDIKAELLKINAGACKPPLDEDEVARIAKSVMRYKPPAPKTPYRATRNGLVFLKHTKLGICSVPLTNFCATIKSNILLDDGLEKSQNFEIEVLLGNEKSLVSVPASNFASLHWIIESVGPSAIVYAGHGSKDHVRVAIQVLSKNINSRTIFRHTGWRKIGNRYLYLTGNGAIESDGFVDSIEVGLPDGLDKYKLIKPESKKALVCAIRASLKIVDVVPDYIGIPLYCAIWRSILTKADYSIHLAGPTGTGKSVIAALVQQHFGSAMCSRNLPGSWSSTANALEGLAFTIKDAVFVIDDFAPDGARTDVQRLHKTAARIFRAQGNHSGRQRMRANGSLKVSRPPRGLVMSTGEDIPVGQSVRARVFMLELSGKDLDWEKVTDCQSNAEKELFEKTTFGFIRWLAPRYEEIQKNLASELMRLRSKATQSNMHKRTPEIIASQYIGMQYFVEYAKDVGAITEGEAAELLDRCWDALGQAGYKQLMFQRAMEPTQRFLELISSALSSGRAHLADRGGDAPPTPYAYGWRRIITGTGSYEKEQWNPKGDQIGWVDGGDIFLDPDASFRIAQSVGSDNGLSVTLGTLKKRLKEKSLIITEDKRETLTVRRRFQGNEHNVLFLKPNVLVLQDPDKPDIPDDLPEVDDDIPI